MTEPTENHTGRSLNRYASIDTGIKVLHEAIAGKGPKLFFGTNTPRGHVASPFELATAFRVVIVFPGHRSHDRVVTHYGVALVRIPVGDRDEFGIVDEQKVALADEFFDRSRGLCLLL